MIEVFAADVAVDRRIVAAEASPSGLPFDTTSTLYGVAGVASGWYETFTYGPRITPPS